MTFEEIFEIEEEYYIYRTDLAVVFSNLAQVKAVHSEVLQAVGRAFDFVKNSDIRKLRVAQVELPLFLMFHLHQTIPPAEKQRPDSPYGILARNLTEVDFLSFHH